MFRSFLKDRKATVATIFALSLVPVLLAIGVAVDLSRAYMVKLRLTAALDAAGLAVGTSSGTDAELQQVMSNFFHKNYPDWATGDEIELSMVNTADTVSLKAVYRLPTFFMNLGGFSHMDVAAASEISKEVKGLEVVLALDNTGSMASNGKIQALRTAATDLVNILFGSQEAPAKLKVGLVPFVTAVNIGQANSAYVNWGAQQPLPWGGFETVTPASYATNADGSATGTVWKGCVKERPYPLDVTDNAGPWDPYFWPREPRYRDASPYQNAAPWSTSNSSNCQNRSASNGTGSTQQVGTRYSTVDEAVSDSNTASYGPNQSCPQPIQPLTNQKSAILAAVNQMVPWGGQASGTMTHVGLAWAERVISPDPPFTEGLPYDSEGWTKAIVILTDGANNIVRQDSVCSTHAKGAYTDYTGYGYAVDEGALGTAGIANKSDAHAVAMAALDTRLSQACTNIKQKNVTIYAITFQASGGIQTLFRNCASDSKKYFDSPGAADLQKVFKQIANDLAKLRVSK